MKYDFYNQATATRRSRIIRAQQVLYRRILGHTLFSSALEIGPGYGGFAEFCRRRGVAYQAVEQNSKLSTQLSDEGFIVHTANAASLPVSLDQFDLIMLSHVVEHLGTHQDVEHVLGELLAHLTPNGRLVLLFPAVDWEPLHFYGDYTHTFPTTLRALRKLLGDLGLHPLRAGHYVGRWTRGWRALWLAHRLMPTWLLPTELADAIADRFAVHAYLVAERNTGRVSNEPSKVCRFDPLEVSPSNPLSPDALVQTTELIPGIEGTQSP